jgi:outer membrane protein
MLARVASFLALAVGLLFSVPALAGQIAVVDFQKAVTQTVEGKAAQSKIDTMYQSRKQEIDKIRTDLEAAVQDYQSRAMILSEQARSDTEAKLGQQQQDFETKYQQYQQELQQTYGQLLQDLDQKMRALVVVIAKEKGYTMVMDQAAVVYTGADVYDMTNDLVSRYDATYKP